MIPAPSRNLQRPPRIVAGVRMSGQPIACLGSQRRRGYGLTEF